MRCLLFEVQGYHKDLQAIYSYRYPFQTYYRHSWSQYSRAADVCYYRGTSLYRLITTHDVNEHSRDHNTSGLALSFCDNGQHDTKRRSYE